MKAILTWGPARPLFILQRANADCQVFSRLQDPRPGKSQESPKPSTGNHLSGALNHEEKQNKTKPLLIFSWSTWYMKGRSVLAKTLLQYPTWCCSSKRLQSPRVLCNSSSVSRTQPQPSVPGVNIAHCHQDTFFRVKSQLTKSLLLLQPPTKEASSTHPSGNTSILNRVGLP